ncbi:MAG: 30S ribosomal protein S11 [Nanoarchaeota archaeon]|nr:30S ribosomal protein S11 [Nanoarchaeota archaeon]
MVEEKTKATHKKEKKAEEKVEKATPKKVAEKIDSKIEEKSKTVSKKEKKVEDIKEKTVSEIEELSSTPIPKKEKKAEEKWGILHIYSSYNNTHLHVTDITGSETVVKVTGGMVSKTDRLKASPNVAFAAAKQISESCIAAGFNCLYVKLRAVGGHNGPMTSGPGAQAAIRMLTRYGIKLGRIEDVTPVPHDTCRKKGGRRGRRV